MGSGGGIYLVADSGGSVINIARSTIEDNTANSNGGGIYIDITDFSSNDTVVNLTDSTIANNTATNSNGGGMWICPKSLTILFNATNSTFSGNRAPNDDAEEGGAAAAAGGEGGGLWIGIATTGSIISNLVNSTITGNVANNGGGLFSQYQ